MKSDILNLDGPDVSDSPSVYDCTVLDGAVIVHILHTKAASNLDEYAK